MTDNKEKPKRQRKKPPEQRRLTETQLSTMGEIFGQNFVEWYKSSYDEEGNLRPSARIPGLRTQKEDES